MLKNLLNRFLLFVDDGAGDGAGGEGDAKGDAKASLHSSIDDAADEIEKEIGKGKGDGKDEKDEASADDDDKDDDADEDDEKEKELSAEELIHAKNLFKLLNSKETGVNTLKSLAASAGLKIEEITTKKEETAAVKTIKDRIREGLGDDYKFLGDKLGTILESVLSDAVKEQTKDIRDKQTLNEQNVLKEQVKTAQESVLGEYKSVPTKVLQEILRIQVEGEMLPGTKSKPETFFKACLIMAADNLKYDLVKKGSADTSTRKGKSPLDELAESRGSTKAGTPVVQVKNMQDAIDKAVEAVEASSRSK